MMANYEGGNVDLRVPYIGYSSESESYTAAGISAYNALQAHVEKRLSHGLQVGFSYTFSHATDEQSALGLFYNGNNPLDLRSGYGLSDFDRKHVINFTYLYQLPNFFEAIDVQGQVGGWVGHRGCRHHPKRPALQRHRLLRRGGQYFLRHLGRHHQSHRSVGQSCTPSGALTGHSGATDGQPALNASCFTLPVLNPGDLGGAIPAGDTFETNFTTGQRNIFRQPWQKRTDVSIVKMTQADGAVLVEVQL